MSLLFICVAISTYISDGPFGRGAHGRVARAEQAPIFYLANLQLSSILIIQQYQFYFNYMVYTIFFNFVVQTKLWVKSYIIRIQCGLERKSIRITFVSIDFSRFFLSNKCMSKEADWPILAQQLIVIGRERRGSGLFTLPVLAVCLFLFIREEISYLTILKLSQ